MLTKALKEGVVKEYKEKFTKNPSLMVVEYKGMSVKQIQSLRRQLKKARVDFKVVKNTLLKKASEDTEVEKIKDLFVGPTAIALCSGDTAAVAKVFMDSMKEFSALQLKGGLVDGVVMGVEEISRLSKLPSKDVLLSQFAGLISSPLSNFVGTLSELQRRLLYLLNSVRDMKESQEKGED